MGLLKGSLEISDIREEGFRFGVGGVLIFVVVVGVGGGNVVLILGSSLCFATIALFPEGEVEIVAHDTNPITIFGLRE